LAFLGTWNASTLAFLGFWSDRTLAFLGFSVGFPRLFGPPRAGTARTSQARGKSLLIHDVKQRRSSAQARSRVMAYFEPRANALEHFKNNVKHAAVV
jgi:hypothetical protein